MEVVVDARKALSCQCPRGVLFSARPIMLSMANRAAKKGRRFKAKVRQVGKDRLVLPFSFREPLPIDDRQRLSC